MKVVIEIPDDRYNQLMTDDIYLDVPIFREDIIATLPKGHGRLIDADAFISKMEDASTRNKYKELLIDDCLTVDDVFQAIIESLQNIGLAEGDAPTIIEADSEEDGLDNLDSMLEDLWNATESEVEE